MTSLPSVVKGNSSPAFFVKVKEGPVEGIKVKVREESSHQSWIPQLREYPVWYVMANLIPYGLFWCNVCYAGGEEGSPDQKG